MAPQRGKKMPEKRVHKTKRKSKEDKKKEMVRMKKNAEKIKQSKQVPILLKEFDKVYMQNFKTWLLNFSIEALAEMQCKEVNFGILLAKFGLLQETFIEVIENWLGELAKNCDTGIVPSEKPEKNSGLILDSKLLQLKPWLDLLHFLLQPLATYENMCVKHVQRALELLNLGFAKSVHPTIKQKHKIPDGDLHKVIRDKLLKQQELAIAKNAERAEKQRLAELILNSYKNLNSPITWEKDSRPVTHPGLVVSLDLDDIFGPFSISKQGLKDLQDDARKDAIKTSLKWYHILALRIYTGPYFKKLNAVLRSTGNEAEFKKYAHFLVHLTNALSLLEKLPQDQTTVYRGTAFFELNIQQDEKLVFQAPTSASKSMRVANGFMGSKGIYFVIKALTAASIENFSLFEHEKEVLFPPNSHFEVKMITQDKGEMAKVLTALTDHDIQNIQTMVVLEQYA